MAWTYTYDTATPAGDASPTEGDDRIREIKAALQERENVDHYWPLDAVYTTQVLHASAGTHRQITFVAPITTPTPAADEGILYTKAAAAKSELHFVGEDGAEKQLTVYDTGNTVQCLNLELKDVVAGTGIVDDDTIEVDGTNGIQLKAGGAGTGILKSHLGTTAKDFVDDDTLENDGTNGLQLKVPAAGANADYCGVPVVAGGDYTGGETPQTIVAFAEGVLIKKLIIRSDKSISDNDTGIEYIITDAGARGWNQKGYSLQTNDTFDGNEFTVAGNELTVNDTGRSYKWFAIGVWAAG